MRQIQGWGFEISFWAWAEYQTEGRIGQMFFTTNKIWKSGQESGWEDNGRNAVNDNGRVWDGANDVAVLGSGKV